MTTLFTLPRMAIASGMIMMLCSGCTTSSSDTRHQYTDTVRFHRDDGTLNMIRVLDRHKVCRVTMHYSPSGVMLLHEKFNESGIRETAEHFHEDGRLSHKEAFDRIGTKRHSELYDKKGNLARVETFDAHGNRRSAKWLNPTAGTTLEEYYDKKGKQITKSK